MIYSTKYTVRKPSLLPPTRTTGQLDERDHVDPQRRGHRRTAGGDLRLLVRPPGAHEHFPPKTPPAAGRQDAPGPAGAGPVAAEGDAVRALRPQRPRPGDHGEVFFCLYTRLLRLVFLM